MATIMNKYNWRCVTCGRLGKHNAMLPCYYCRKAKAIQHKNRGDKIR